MSTLNTGSKLGPYEIQEVLGTGGMGQVWKARDSRLNRFVAIKKSQEQFSERFAREAQAIAALNHAHICQLYDVGPDYLVMEYVDGRTLTGPLPIPKVLEYAAQICAALDAAHRKGIVHRDLKPGNILVGKDGVKILDFGLAKMEKDPNTLDGTPTKSVTEAGAVLGTLQYMSPEQIEGEPADARSDIFAFGLVLYEMITGKPAFTGKSRTSLIASILKDEPAPIRQLEPVAPAQLERVVQTCLEKDPEKRWQSAREVKHALDWLKTEPAPVSPATERIAATPSRQRSWLWPAISAALLLVLIAGGLILFLKPAPEARETRFEVTLPEGVEFSQYVSVSPDGHKLVFNATGVQSGLWIRDLETLQWRKLAGTEGSSSPFWSPDSRYLGFSVRTDLKKIDVSGGPPQTLCTVTGTVGTGSWSKENVIIFGGKGSGPIRRVPAAGGVATDVTEIDAKRGEAFHGLPTFLPDGKHFVHLRVGTPDITGMYVGNIDEKPGGQSKEQILNTVTAASYVSGFLFFLRDGTLMAQPFDENKLKLTGDPVPVAEHVGAELSNGYFSVSPSGVLAYRAGASLTSGFQPTWFDQDGKVLGTFGQPGTDQNIALSPDGNRAAGRNATGASQGDIWLLDFMRGVRTRVTFRQSAGSPAVWSPDSSRIIFAAGNLLDTLFEKAVSGAGEEKELFKRANEIKVPTGWSRDGKFLLYDVVNSPSTGRDFWVLPLDGERKPVVLMNTQFNEGNAVFSADGRWISYTSNESGRPEIYVRPFNASSPSLGDGKWQVSRDGATSAKWRSDGKEIYFQRGNVFFAAEISANGAAFQSGTPKRLFEVPIFDDWDVTGDGKRFLLTVVPKQENGVTPITVVLNWQANLKK